MRKRARGRWNYQTEPKYESTKFEQNPNITKILKSNGFISQNFEETETNLNPKKNLAEN